MLFKNLWFSVDREEGNFNFFTEKEKINVFEYKLFNKLNSEYEQGFKYLWKQ